MLQSHFRMQAAGYVVDLINIIMVGGVITHRSHIIKLYKRRLTDRTLRLNSNQEFNVNKKGYKYSYLSPPNEVSRSKCAYMKYNQNIVSIFHFNPESTTI
jgi:hypothetical protein